MNVVKETRLVDTDCYTCGMPFAIPDWLDKQAREKGRAWICPGCGSRTVYSKTKVQELQEKLEKERQRAYSREKHLEDQRQAAERSLRATKGQVTKLKKRIGRGVCPCCNRHFANVERHMASQHPEYVEAVE